MGPPLPAEHGSRDAGSVTRRGCVLKVVRETSYLSELVGEQQYSFGRGDDCEYCFEVHGGRKLPLFLSLSKTHFVLYKVSISTPAGETWC